MAAGDERRSGLTGDAHGLSYGWYRLTAATTASRKMQHGRLGGGGGATRVEGESPLVARVEWRGTRGGQSEDLPRMHEVVASTVDSPYSELRNA